MKFDSEVGSQFAWLLDSLHGIFITASHFTAS